jgi:hypothetical protein
MMAIILYAYGMITRGSNAVITTDEEFEALSE